MYEAALANTRTCWFPLQILVIQELHLHLAETLEILFLNCVCMSDSALEGQKSMLDPLGAGVTSGFELLWVLGTGVLCRNSLHS